MKTRSFHILNKLIADERGQANGGYDCLNNIKYGNAPGDGL